jgi:hypothetical protein
MYFGLVVPLTGSDITCTVFRLTKLSVGAASSGTAQIDQGLETSSVEDMVVVEAPGCVLPPVRALSVIADVRGVARHGDRHGGDMERKGI